MNTKSLVSQSNITLDRDISNNARAVTAKIHRFLTGQARDTPFLVVDLDIIAQKYLNLSRLLPQAQVYYAMKANPAPEILKLLVEIGSSFDTASVFEIEQCIAAGAEPDRISYGSTIKKARDIAYAYKLGVRLFAFDSLCELEKIATNAPGARVYCRLLTNNDGASDLPNDLPLKTRDHVIQFEKHKWRDSNSIARCLSHSCEPNCGIQDLFKIVAMRDIKKDEELCWDYEMSENSDWQMECLCGSKNCRKLIGVYKYMPQNIREKYGDYISGWLK